MQLNFLVNDMSASQLSFYLIKEINRLTEQLETSHIDCIVFYENMAQLPIAPNFAIMQIAEAWAQSEPVVATSLSTAAKLIDFPATHQKFFYVWDLEWLRGQRKVYNWYEPIYTNKKLSLIARSKEHADLIRNAYNRDVCGIVENFKIEDLINVIRTTRR